MAATWVGYWTWIWPWRHSWPYRKWLVDIHAGKIQPVWFDYSNNFDNIHIEMDWTVLDEKPSFKKVRLFSSSKLDSATTTFKKIGALIRPLKFASFQVALNHYKSTVRPCMEYCFHVWIGPPNFCMDMLKKLQGQVRWAVCATLATSLEPLAYSRHFSSQILL